MNGHDPLSPIYSDKILPHHLLRWAIVYVRQSSTQQLHRHKESALVQASLRGRALQWGWDPQRILILDGDQGRSATTTVGRDDFAWLLSEIALGHVGIVLGLQINRLAREDEACCRLIRTCAAFDTLLADLDGVYHPHDFNDRMILTLKGFMGGFELHQLQQRMQAGRLNRVRRGDWLGQPPNGFIVGPDGKLAIDPDEEVAQRLHGVFREFERLGSISSLLRQMRQHQLDLPFRPRFGPTAGALQWRRPTRESLRQILRHPAYAGVFTWGRRAVLPSKAIEGRRGSGRVEHEPDQCQVFLRDNHAAYITWEQYQAHRQQLRQQRQRGPIPGPQRQTKAVLAGLLVCGKCGKHLLTRYTQTLRYQCQRQALDEDAQPCPAFAGEPLEHLVRDQILQVMTPAGLELCLHAIDDHQRHQAELHQNWKLRLERAQLEAERAFRQYDAVEPENRLAARCLERRWEEKLKTHQDLQEEYDRVAQERPPSLNAAERAQIEALANDLPRLWHSPHTSIADQRQVARLLLDQVVVWASRSSPVLRVQLHWKGGVVTEATTTRALRSWEQMPNLEQVLAEIARHRTAGKTAKQIAELLTSQGHVNVRGKPFTAWNVRQLLSRWRQQRRQRRGAKPGR